MRLTWLALPLVLLLALAGCDDEAEAPVEAEPSGPEEAPPPTPSSPWEGMPSGFSPVVLPAAEDPCEGPVIWLGPDDVRRTPSLPPARFGGPSASLAPGVAREVQAAMGSGPDDPHVEMGEPAGAYNGPGGEPLFRWHLSRTGGLPVIVVDRRVSGARLIEALRGTESGAPIRIGGVDEDGGRRCAIGLVEAAADLGAQNANELFAGRLAPDGSLRARGTSAERAVEPVQHGRPMRDEAPEGLHVVRFDPPEGATGAALLRAFAAARWAERRYGWLRLPGFAPYCLPLVSGCGCVGGCARGVRLIEGGPIENNFRPMLGARVEVRTSANAEPQEAQIQLWCFNAQTGEMSRVGRIEGRDCFEVYVSEEGCGGGCTARQMPDCGACEACDASCAGDPIRR